MTGLKFEVICDVDYQQNSGEEDGAKVFEKTASHYSICCLLILTKEDKNTERQEPEDGKNDGVYQQYEHHKLNRALHGGICFLDRTV